ncbi:type II toxin-antitoxin system RelE family toxin [Candidatus Amarolinea aalborgensis]|uniref:type II toxin-antitoxin system RelE family toxin n=1 Tax=Candidatus Amarolinea aalborgensis TaxID=2249329 RepID=UPI003BF9D47B
MAYRIAFSRQIRLQIGGLPGHVKAIAKHEIAALSDDPRPRHSQELAEHPGHFRLWLGRDYRLVWLVLDDEQLVEIE